MPLLLRTESKNEPRVNAALHYLCYLASARKNGASVCKGLIPNMPIYIVVFVNQDTDRFFVLFLFYFLLISWPRKTSNK